jgi:type I restriction-modification system DNA methylase subunit
MTESDYLAIVAYLRSDKWQTAITKENDRVKKTGEIFTPTELVDEILDKLDPELFKDPTKTFLDPTCGNGQFLVEVLIRKIANGIPIDIALSMIYGVELMQDNVNLTIERLSLGNSYLKKIVKRNIKCADALEFDYNFDDTANRKLLKKKYKQI